MALLELHNVQIRFGLRLLGPFILFLISFYFVRFLNRRLVFKNHFLVGTRFNLKFPLNHALFSSSNRDEVPISFRKSDCSDLTAMAIVFIEALII